MRRTAAITAAIVLGTSLLGGIAVLAPTRAGAATAAHWGTCPPEQLAPLPPAVRPRLRCATYQVPLDYQNPGAGTTGVAMMRRAAEDPANRVGVLFVAAGGPGGSGIVRLTELEGQLPAEVTQRFDLIGFDPRGVQSSGPLRCFATQEEAAAVYGSVVGVPVTGPEIAATLRAYRAATRACAANAGPLLPHMSTLDVARDLDRLRQAVGEPQLNFLGYSYATLVGATYANLFPDRTRAMVLDGNVDAALRTTDGMEYQRQRAAGTEAVIGDFLRACVDAGPQCAFSQGDPAARFAEIRRRLRQGPVAVPGLGEVTLSQFTDVVANTLYTPEEYPDLAGVLQALYAAVHPTAGQPAAGQPAAAPRAAAMAAASRLLAAAEAGTPYSGSEASAAVDCLDQPFPRSPARFVQAAAQWERQLPTTGRAAAFTGAVCGSWPVRDPERYSGPWNRRTGNPLLLFGNRHDPATNYGFNQRMAAELGSARLVTVDMFGHTVIGRARSRCADALAARYLVTLALPPAGSTCAADAAPFG